jgi:prepilin-type N-terminal cleavage/methylation domain-containing protein
MKRRQRGFTLIELLAVLTLITIAAAIVIGFIVLYAHLHPRSF